MILSKTATYALRATLCLAESEDGRPMRVDDIAARLDVPRNYLSKILHSLARTSLLESTRGPRGGFRLAAPPTDIRLADVVGSFDDVPGDATCLLGREACTDAEPCRAHEQWKHVRVSLAAFLERTSLADLAPEPSSADPTSSPAHPP